jgi:hypothetical protein
MYRMTCCQGLSGREPSGPGFFNSTITAVRKSPSFFGKSEIEIANDVRLFAAIHLKEYAMFAKRAIRGYIVSEGQPFVDQPGVVAKK